MKQKKRGGYRENAGRPLSGRKPFKIMCKPENITKIREWIKTNDY